MPEPGGLLVLSLLLCAAGALIILRPGFETVTWGALAAIGAAASYASVNLCARVLSRTEATISVAM